MFDKFFEAPPEPEVAVPVEDEPETANAEVDAKEATSDDGEE